MKIALAVFVGGLLAFMTTTTILQVLAATLRPEYYPNGVLGLIAFIAIVLMVIAWSSWFTVCVVPTVVKIERRMIQRALLRYRND